VLQDTYTKEELLLIDYRWIFSPEWITFTSSDTFIVAAMSSPTGLKGTAGRKRRSRSVETGKDEETASPPQQDSPLEHQLQPEAAQGLPEEAQAENVEGSPLLLPSKKRKKRETREEEEKSEKEEEGDVSSTEHVKEKDKTGKDQAEDAALGREKSKIKNKSKSQLKRKKVKEGVVGAASASGESARVKVRENPIGSPHLPNPGNPEAGIGEDGQRKGDVDPCDDTPLLARSPLPAGKTATKKQQKRMRRKRAGKAGKAKPGVKVDRKPARLGGLFRRLLESSSPGADLAEWQTEPPLADVPNQAFAQRATESALLDTLMGRARLLDKLGSPLPVTRLLRSLCSGSFENAAAH